uniref:Uncharacterized protein n=1 Tax=Solanum tuberosum TaxID=4113 RepID=M1BA71_SOLTU
MNKKSLNIRNAKLRIELGTELRRKMILKCELGTSNKPEQRSSHLRIETSHIYYIEVVTQNKKKGNSLAFITFTPL